MRRRYLGPEDVSPFNGGTWVVPGSHRDARNPRGPDDGIDERAPIPGELQVSAPAGSVFLQDTRLWHAGALNQSAHERTAIVCAPMIPQGLCSRVTGVSLP